MELAKIAKMQRVKVTANPKLGEWLQQVPGTTSKISVGRSAVQEQLRYCT